MEIPFGQNLVSAKIFFNFQVKHHPSNTDVKCQVCGGKAAGFHYGADVCTRCKLINNPANFLEDDERAVFVDLKVQQQWRI